jgi:hypothetical protein
MGEGVVNDLMKSWFEMRVHCWRWVVFCSVWYQGNAICRANPRVKMTCIALNQMSCCKPQKLLCPSNAMCHVTRYRYSVSAQQGVLMLISVILLHHV